ncbi:MAG: small multi-drug export protein [bacterium]|nr:small multi-drug export protein [bacterium]
MKEQIIEAFVKVSLPKEVLTLLISMLPVVELRGALPVAITFFGFSWPKAYFLSVLGNMLPVLPFILFLHKFSDFLMKFSFFKKVLTWWFKRAEKHEALIQRFEAIGLTLFVAIPLPVTGAWTACVIAYVFGIKKRYAFPAILVGVMIAGAVVSFITVVV